MTKIQNNKTPNKTAYKIDKKYLKLMDLSEVIAKAIKDDPSLVKKTDDENTTEASSEK